MNATKEYTELFQKLQSVLTEDEVLYNTFVASIASALTGIPIGTGIYDIAKEVADVIIGTEE